MSESAELMGFEEHLTTSSEATEAGWDFWFGLNRSQLGVSWDKAFEEKASAANGDLCARLEIFPFTSSRGWIVARGVPASVSPADAETRIRALVDQVNGFTCHMAHAEPVPTVHSSGSRIGVRSLLRDAATAVSRSFGDYPSTAGHLPGS